jgi:hypothetical protein
VKDYVDNVLPLYTLDDLRQHFRITRSTFDQIVILLSPKLIVGNKGGIMKVPVEKQLLIFIRYASSQQTLTEITDTFSVCEATIHAVINNTTVHEGNISLEIQYRTSERLNDWCLTYLRYGKNKYMYD